MYYNKGVTTRQAHVDIPEGTVEEEYARDGFFGRSVHLYRTAPPLAWTAIEGDLRPEAFDTARLHDRPADDYLKSRIPFLFNDDVLLAKARLEGEMPYLFRNADADEILFVHQGVGRFETDFGPLRYERGDYLVVPRGTAYRFCPADTTELLVIESRDEVGLPEKGILGQHALFDPGVINVPTPEALTDSDESGEWRIKVKRRGRISTLTYPHNPLNVVGWKGDLTVWQLNIRDIRPISSERYHLPPTAHVTFMMKSVVVCTFLPRPLETGDPGALKVPFYHSNIDYDEVLFYHDGDFFSRTGIKPGMVTFHPQGLPHGPQPQAVEAAKLKTRTSEQAVMVDTRFPLEMAPAAREISIDDYWTSWMPKDTPTREATDG